MITRVYPPWHEGKGDGFSRSFHETNHKFLALVCEGTVQLSQFQNLTVDAREEFIRGLGWRHFITLLFSGPFCGRLVKVVDQLWL